MVRGIESRWGARFSAPVHTALGAHAASYTMGMGSFPGVKRPGRGADHPPPSSAEVEGRVELYICSPSGRSWPLLGRALPFTFYCRFHLRSCSGRHVAVFYRRCEGHTGLASSGLIFVPTFICMRCEQLANTLCMFALPKEG